MTIKNKLFQIGLNYASSKISPKLAGYALKATTVGSYGAKLGKQTLNIASKVNDMRVNFKPIEEGFEEITYQEAFISTLSDKLSSVEKTFNDGQSFFGKIAKQAEWEIINKVEKPSLKVFGSIPGSWDNEGLDYQLQQAIEIPLKVK